MLTVREHRYPFLQKVGDWNRFSQNTGGTLVEKCCHFFDLMRFIMKANPVRLFASGSMNHNHRDEIYDGRVPDILDNAYVVLDFPDRRRAMLELCMFAEASEYQEEIIAVSPRGKITCRVPGPSRFWPQDSMGPQPVAELVTEHRDPRRRERADIAVDPVLLEAGDHNGSTFYQHVAAPRPSLIPTPRRCALRPCTRQPRRAIASWNWMPRPARPPRTGWPCGLRKEARCS